MSMFYPHPGQPIACNRCMMEYPDETSGDMWVVPDLDISLCGQCSLPEVIAAVSAED